MNKADSPTYPSRHTPRMHLILPALLLVLLAVAVPRARAESFVVTSTADAGPGTLRQAMLDAEANAAADTITFDLTGDPANDCSLSIPDEAECRITLTSGALPAITKPEGLTIAGGASPAIIIDGNSSQIFIVESSGVLTLQNLIIGGGGGVDGGAIANAGELTLADSSLFENSAGGDGGGVYNSGSLTLLGSRFADNRADGGSGGAIYSTGSVLVSGSGFRTNAAGYGGAIYNDGGTLTVEAGSSFETNSAGEDGGALYSGGTAGDLGVVDSSFSGNEAKFGAAVAVNAGTFAMGGSSFSGNTAARDGGAVHTYGDGTISDSSFSGNTALDTGGGALYSAGTVEVSNSEFVQNRATIGGAIYSFNEPLTITPLTITGSTFSENDADTSGGAVFSAMDVTVSDTVFEFNEGLNGGAIHLFSATLQVSGSTFHANRASGDGGALYAAGSSGVAMVNSTLSGNDAGDYGGGILAAGGSTATATNTTLYANSASSGGASVSNSGDGGSGSLGTVILRNSITTAGCVGASDGGGNLGSDASCPGYTTEALQIEAALQDNGGPTPTHALLAGSPAIDHAPAASCEGQPVNGVDQRGFFRSVDGDGTAGDDECDAGAFEFGAAADGTAPEISYELDGTLGDNGWYVSDVIVTWTVEDPESPVGNQNGCDATTVDDDTSGITFTCTATSDGGTNEVTTEVIKRDATPPEVEVAGVLDGERYILGSEPQPACMTTDATAGVATEATLAVTGGSANGVGEFAATCEGAEDNAGNAAAAVSVTYRVIYDFSGFYPPIRSLPAINSARAGETVPVKFSLDGDQGPAIFAGGYPQSEEVSCDNPDPGSGTEATLSAGRSSLTYDAHADQYIYRWKTDKRWQGECRALLVRLADGEVYVALFQFR